ncbi:MAG: undecaprenyldiphospho-muramoylpentapeptide beta-N-acetylglucosaminyltransferase [Idiomarina sp.]|nr:undecaprenyldiphospho-muramoylpentapeptide beta-N-acetylglucosaminyltransferase [Idiomarina sp.]
MSHVLISAGGTGGHVFPAMAVAAVLKEQGHQITWLGTTDRMEAELVPAHGYRFIGMQQQALRGKSKLSLLLAPFKLLASIRRCRALLKQEKPDLVLGFGGYTAGPAGVAAWSLKTPLIIHEQNAIPGLTNKLLARFATRTLLGFSRAQQFLAQGELVGNPVRAEITDLDNTVASTRNTAAALNILVVGGSLGAAYLNKLLPEALANWRGGSVNVQHQAGKGNAAAVAEAYEQAQKNTAVNVQVSDFITDMAAAYATADIVICRAGALTVAELACAGKAAILVPYPYAVDDHQTENAKVLSEAGAALLIQQQDLTAQWLLEQLAELVAEPERLTIMHAQALKAAEPNATAHIVAVCNEYIELQAEPAAHSKTEQTSL